MSFFGRYFSVDPCCGSVKLSVASLLVAGAEIIFSTSAIVIYILSLTTMDMYKTDEAFRDSGISRFVNFWDFQRENQDIDQIKKRLARIFGVSLFINFVNLIIAGVLIFAVRRRHITLVKVWILCKALGLSLCLVYLLTTIFLDQATLVGIFLDVIQIIVLFYFFWVVMAFMKELVEEQVLKMSPSIIQAQGKIEVSFPL